MRRAKQRLKEVPAVAALVEARKFLRAKREYGFELAVPPGHFYLPIPSAADVRRAKAAAGSVVGVPGVDLHEERQVALVRRLGPFMRGLPFGPRPEQGFRYGWTNGLFGPIDGAILYAMLREHRPARIIEVGSGWSSLMLDVNEHHLGGSCRLTFIEPYADRLRSLLLPSDRSGVNIIERPVQEVDLALFDQLGPGDLLFIDSSHVSKMGSDLNRLLFEVVPRLPAGTLVHFHDICWPFEYPEPWAARAWNEAYLVRAFLTSNADFEITLFADWLANARPEEAQAVLPSWRPTSGGGSLWITRTRTR